MTLLYWATSTVTRPTRPRKWPSPFRPFGPRGSRTGEGARLHRAAVAGQIPMAAGIEFQLEGVEEQASKAADQIWGSGEEGAHRMGLAAAEWIDGGGKATASQSGSAAGGK
jgi:hypothetical protein